MHKKVLTKNLWIFGMCKLFYKCVIKNDTLVVYSSHGNKKNMKNISLFLVNKCWVSFSHPSR